MKIWLILFVVYAEQLGSVRVNANFADAWTNFTKDPQLLHASYSITVLDNSTGNIIFSSNENLGLAPASTLKTVTGAAAFHYLGTDYQYKTTLQYSGRINPTGVLNGYIYIVGTGDPSLGSSRWNQTDGDVLMQRWVNAIHAQGIKHCRGIVLDLSAWPGDSQTIPNGYTWGDLGNYYGAGHSALNWRENKFDFYLSPGNALGDPVTLVYINRPPPSVTIINEATTGPAGIGDDTRLFLAPDSKIGYLRGQLSIDSPKNSSIGGAIPNPPLYIADELRQSMGWSNYTPIQVIYTKMANATSRITLDEYLSPPMSELVYWFEKASINMYGEVFVKTIAYSINTTADNVLSVYCEVEHGIEETALSTMDASGLSPENRITTFAIARVLYNVRKQAPWFPWFERALPVINGIVMKSGYIYRAYSYAGYVNSQVFSIITNNFNGPTSTMRSKIYSLLNLLK